MTRANPALFDDPDTFMDDPNVTMDGTVLIDAGPPAPPVTPHYALAKGSPFLLQQPYTRRSKRT